MALPFADVIGDSREDDSEGDGDTNGTNIAGFVVPVDSMILSPLSDDDHDVDVVVVVVDGTAEMDGMVGKFWIRLISNSTKTASGCTCRTNAPARDADTSDICAVPNK